MGLALALLAVSAAPAWSYSTAPGWVASDYVTGFPKPADPDEAGPLGLAFDGAGNLYVTDIEAGTFHRVPPGGGTAAGTLVAGGLGKAAGLAFGLDGRLYMARADRGRVDQVDPRTGGTVRTVVSGLPCPTALATDPLSGDLFASNKCGNGPTQRIFSPEGSSAVARTYANQRDDGITFAPDGTLFAAAYDERVDQITGTNSPAPGSESTIARVDEIDGIAYSPAGREAAYLVVNRNNGEIDKLEFDGTITPILTGGSRGDLVTVGPDRCIYAGLQERVVKLAPATGSCAFAPPAGPAQSVLGERISPVLDLRIRGRAAKRVRRGSRFRQRLRVVNRGPSRAHRVVLRDRLAKGLRFVSARPSRRGVRCRHRGRRVVCTKRSLPRGKAFRVTMVLRAMHRRRYANVARVTSKDLDNAPGNNRTRQLTRVKGGPKVLGVQRTGRSPRTTG